MEKSNSLNSIKFSFAALNPYTEVVIPVPEEKIIPGRGFVTCGIDNRYPEYLNKLYRNVTILKSCIDTSVDYVCGDGIEANTSLFPDLEDLVRDCVRDYFIFGGFAVDVIRSVKGTVTELHYIPFYRLRSDEKNTKFWYSKDWHKSFGRVQSLCYPRYEKDSQEPHSIYYFNNMEKVQTYPMPVWSGAVEAAEIQRRINQFHINSLANSFQGSYIISFNNGMPNDIQKQEIEDDINEKFSGTENTGRIMVSFAKDKDHALDIKKLDIDDYGAKYKDLKERSESEIYRAFRLNARLLGDNSDTTGFTDTEFQDAFRLYNRTVVRPVQRTVVKAFNDIIDCDLTIKPFNL